MQDIIVNSTLAVNHSKQSSKDMMNDIIAVENQWKKVYSKGADGVNLDGESRYDVIRKEHQKRLKKLNKAKIEEKYSNLIDPKELRKLT